MLWTTGRDIKGGTQWLPNEMLGTSSSRERQQMVPFDRHMWLLVSVLYWSNSQPAPFLRLLPLKCKTSHISIPHSSYSVEFGIPGYYDPEQLWHADSQDIDHAFHVSISNFFVALCDHNPPTLQTDEQTDIMLVTSVHL